MNLKLNAMSFSRDMTSRVSARVAFQHFHAFRQTALFHLPKTGNRSQCKLHSGWDDEQREIITQCKTKGKIKFSINNIK